MITRLLNEVNEKIETLNNLVQDKEYFKKLDERIEKVNNYAQKQQKEIERLNNIIKEVREYIENNDIMKVEKEGKLRGGIFLDKGLLKILDKGE